MVVVSLPPDTVDELPCFERSNSVSRKPHLGAGFERARLVQVEDVVFGGLFAQQRRYLDPPSSREVPRQALFATTADDTNEAGGRIAPTDCLVRFVDDEKPWPSVDAAALQVVRGPCVDKLEVGAMR